jgi:hypothetical protein
MKDRSYHVKMWDILNADMKTISYLIRRFSGHRSKHDKDYRIKNLVQVRKWARESKRKLYNENPERFTKIAREQYYSNIIRSRSLANNRVKNAYRRNANAYKSEVLMYYGKGRLACICCGERELKFLTLDHIVSRKLSKKPEDKLTGFRLYRVLREKNFPPGYQTMCWNCNSGRALNNGICPHKEIRKEIRVRWRGIA